MTKHTPGPWKLGAGRCFETPSGEFYITYGKDKHGNAKFRDFAELDGNARLISIAPEMLAFIKTVGLLAQHVPGSFDWQPVVDLARGLIARVERT